MRAILFHLLAAGLAPVALAAPLATPSEMVRVERTDLADSASAQQTYARLHAAARRVCLKFVSDTDRTGLSARAEAREARCAAAAAKDAIAQLAIGPLAARAGGFDVAALEAATTATAPTTSRAP